MVQFTEMFQSLQKSHEKADHILNKTSIKTVYKNSRAIRPLMLKVIKFYPCLKNSHKYTEYLQITYNKCNDWIRRIDSEIISLESRSSDLLFVLGRPFVYQANYLKKFLKNLKNLKKLCEESSISYYNSLPGNKIPLDVRSHIVGFISQVPLK